MSRTTGTLDHCAECNESETYLNRHMTDNGPPTALDPKFDFERWQKFYVKGRLLHGLNDTTFCVIVCCKIQDKRDNIPVLDYSVEYPDNLWLCRQFFLRQC